jgi:dTDP-4-amino-4,6-dideoxygalactose transaminase
MAVHLYGQVASLTKLKNMAAKNNLMLIEDCAQAHLAKYNGTPVGGFGIAGCFSFYPSKNLGAYGEGGAVLTNDASLYKQMKLLREHGSDHKYHHECIGQNYRLPALQAAILDVKLKYLKQWTIARQQIAQWYNEGLKDLPQIHIPEVMSGVDHVYHLYVIRTTHRNALINYLEKKGIQTSIHYPIPCHLQKAYSHLQIPTGSFPVAEKYADELLSLPIYPELGKHEVDYVCQMVQEFFNNELEIKL